MEFNGYKWGKKGINENKWGQMGKNGIKGENGNEKEKLEINRDKREKINKKVNKNISKASQRHFIC